MRFFVRTLALLLYIFGPAAVAGSDIPTAGVFARLTLAQGSISAEDAAALVQARTGGRVLAVDTIQLQGRVVYRVKVLTPQGEVRVFLVDAATGAM
ncbi:MAG: PepSY domain-containing protein [Acidiferrobacterales bacterium]